MPDLKLRRRGELSDSLSLSLSASLYCSFLSLGLLYIFFQVRSEAKFQTDKRKTAALKLRRGTRGE